MISMLRIFPLLAFVTVCHASSTNPVENITGQILDFGTYQSFRTNNDNHVQFGHGEPVEPVHISTEIEFIKHTDQIVVQKGTIFGFSYKLVNLPTNVPVVLTSENLHPAMIMPDGRTNWGHSAYFMPIFPCSNWTNHFGYRIDRDFELVEGDWILSIYAGTNKLVSKTFHVLTNYPYGSNHQ